MNTTKETTGASREEKTTGMLTQMRALSCLVLLGLASASIAQAAPTISIQGLTGAEHWVWIEGEGDTLNVGGTSSGGRTFRDNSAVSGWMAGGPANSYNRTTGSSDVRSAYWGIHAPAALSANTQIYARARVNVTAGMTVYVDGNVVSPAGAQIVHYSSSAHPTEFATWQSGGNSIGAGISTGALSAGDHLLRYAGASFASSGLNSFIVDGLLLYDGTPILRDTAGNGTGRNWLQNPGSLNSPVISETSVTPSISLTGMAEGNQVYYFLNGQLYTPGTAIGAGEHELVIAIYESDAENSARIAFAGANFTVAGLIPEPSTYGLLVAVAVGGYILVRRRPRCDARG